MALGASEADLLRYITPDETAADFLQRTSTEALPTGLPAIDQHVKFRPGHVLEVVGPTMCGKSELLIQVITHFLMSQAGDATQHPGHVVLVDCDSKFDPLRLLQVLDARLSALPNMPGAAALDAALARFHLVQVHSSAELLLTLLSLPQQLRALQGHCRLLLIDNITAFAWHDRAIKPPPSGPNTPPPVMTWQAAQSALAGLVAHTCEKLHLAAVVTRQAGVRLGEGGGGLELLDQLPPAWQDVIMFKLLLLPAPSGGLPPYQQQRLAAEAAPGATLLLGQAQVVHPTPPVLMRIQGTAFNTCHLAG